MRKLIGEKIKQVRQRKGISQTQLSEDSGVSLRTIQRIEADQTQPQGKTMQLICDALEVPIEDLMDYGKKEDNQYLMFFHLSVLSGIPLPLGNIILPLILWLVKKNEILHLRKIGARLLNFQIVFQIITSAFLIAVIIYKIMHKPLFGLGGLEIYFIVSSLNYIMAIVFAILNYRGKHVTYPSIVPMIR